MFSLAVPGIGLAWLKGWLFVIEDGFVIPGPIPSGLWFSKVGLLSCLLLIGLNVL